MEKVACPICSGPLPIVEQGRPAAYCSPVCRRAAGLEVQRLNRRLEQLETRHADALIHRDDFTPGNGSRQYHVQRHQREADAIAARIAEATTRLRDLLDRLGTAGAPRDPA